MKNVANSPAARQLAAATRPSAARLAVCAYPWQAGIGTRPAHSKHRSEMIADVTTFHLRWPGDPSS